jgi:glycosyltransferase involved in cell wall biosynthesis
MVRCSVIICSHNPRADYLRRVIDALQGQILPREEWEILLVDNASNDLLANTSDFSWHPNARHIREEQIGLIFARLRGIEQATGELLVFLDDDNVPHPTYLHTAVEIARHHPNLGCFGAGVIAPEFEKQPSPELQPYLRFLALRVLARTIWTNSPDQPPLPWGAGLCVRRAVAIRYAERVLSCRISQTLGRTGHTLTSGEDDEFSWVAAEMSLGTGIFVELQITHLIDKRRVSKDYLKKMAFGNGYSCGVLAQLHHLPRKSAFKFPRFGDAVVMLLRGRLIRSLYLFLDWICFLRRPAVERSFLKARARGWEKGVQALADLGPSSASEHARSTTGVTPRNSHKDAEFDAHRAT